MKNSKKEFPIFGNIDKLILEVKPRVLVDKKQDKLSFILRQSDLKEIFQSHNLDPDKYTLFNNFELNYKELIPLLLHIIQTHEIQLNNLMI